MNLCVPDTLTVGNSERYRVSIRLSPDGLSFAGFIPSEKDSFFFTETKINKTKKYSDAVKEIFFACPFFSYTYGQVYVISANPQFTLVPESVFDEKQKEQFMSFVFSEPDKKVLYERLDEFDHVLLYGIQPEVYEFFARSLQQPTFSHAVTSLLTEWRKQNLTGYPKQLYVALHENRMIVACFDQGALTFINSFSTDDPADTLYYILYVWKQTELDQMNDELLLYANPLTYQPLKETLPTYLSHIEWIRPQWPASAGDVPPDIMALFPCES
jgi:hypothetical protein